MKAIVVDDEIRAIELLKSYLDKFDEIELKASFRNGLKALEYLSKERVDVVFLDIDMPHISGLALSKLLDPTMHLVFITAHSEFALESYEVNATDYLLKPISFERFAQAVRKILTLAHKHHPMVTEVITLKSGSKSFRVEWKDILYLRKDGNYMHYILTNRKILARESIAEALGKLPSSFLQCHRSYLINKNQVTSFDRESVQIHSHSIPLSDSFRSKVLEELE